LHFLDYPGQFNAKNSTYDDSVVFNNVDGSKWQVYYMPTPYNGDLSTLYFIQSKIIFNFKFPILDFFSKYLFYWTGQPKWAVNQSDKANTKPPLPSARKDWTNYASNVATAFSAKYPAMGNTFFIIPFYILMFLAILKLSIRRSNLSDHVGGRRTVSLPV